MRCDGRVEVPAGTPTRGGKTDEGISRRASACACNRRPDVCCVARRFVGGRRANCGSPPGSLRADGIAAIVGGTGPVGRRGAGDAHRECEGLARSASRGAARPARTGCQQPGQLALPQVHLEGPVRLPLRAHGRAGLGRDAVADVRRPSDHGHRAGSPLPGGSRLGRIRRHGVRNPARQVRDQGQAGPGPDVEPVRSAVGRRSRARGHRADAVRPHDATRRPRRACRVRQRHAVLELLRPALRVRSPEVQGENPAVGVVRVHPVAAPRCLRRRRFRPGEPGQGRDGRDHRRVRRLDAGAGREHLLAAARRQQVRQAPVPGPELPGAATRRPERDRVRRERLVRGAGARRRGRSRDGSRGECPLLRRLELLRRRPARVAVSGRARQQGLDRHQLVGLADLLRRGRRSLLDGRRRPDQRVRVDLQAGRSPGDRLLLLLGRQRRRPRRVRLRAPRVPDRRPVGHLGRRHVARGEQP